MTKAQSILFLKLAIENAYHDKGDGIHEVRFSRAIRPDDCHEIAQRTELSKTLVGFEVLKFDVLELNGHLDAEINPFKHFSSHFVEKFCCFAALENRENCQSDFVSQRKPNPPDLQRLYSHRACRYSQILKKNAKNHAFQIYEKY